MIYSAIWPSGQMDGWINTSTDFYSWIFMAEYHLGLIDPTNPGLTLQFTHVEMDAFGTYVLIGLTALARGQLPYEATSAVVVTFIVWFGTAVYYLVRHVFELSFFQTLFVCIALCLSSFLNYIAMTGMFGHLLSLSLFIISLSQLNNFSSNNLRINRNSLEKVLPQGISCLNAN
jgi:hypothetical protein